MSDINLLFASARDQLAALSRRELSAVELLELHLAHIDRHNGALNLVVTLDVERAMGMARLADEQRRSGAPLGPLAGLPMTVKDSLMTAGCRTTSGAPELADFVPEADAAPVARLKAAGAVIFGKTNLPYYANDVQSYNDLFGTANNPWDPTLSVGGSSGGSAGALAAGFTPLEVGSDIAGSIRNPAAMCGVVGHKSSYGIVSARGQIPGPPGTLTQADLAVIGPMARTVGDCALALDLLAGPDDWNEAAWSLTLPRPRRTTAAGLRVAVMATDPACPVDTEIEAAIHSIADRLAVAGAVVSHEARPDKFDFAKTELTFWNLLGGALAGSWSVAEIEQMAERVNRGEVLGGDLGVLGSTQRHRQWLTNNERRLQIRQRWATFFEQWDVVLAPVAPIVAYPHDHTSPQNHRTIEVNGETRSYMDIMSWMGLFGMAYLPATCLPIGLHSSGLPIGMQVVGPYLHDHTTLAASQVIEDLVNTTFRPPGLG
ncbi:MAG: amidase [Acidimicrobiales bacterium]